VILTLLNGIILNTREVTTAKKMLSFYTMMDVTKLWLQM